MTSRISKLFQFAAVSTFAIAPLTLQINPVRAESVNTITDISTITTTIARNSLNSSPPEESTDDNSNTEAGTARDRSMEYVNSGFEAEQAGNYQLALENYHTAMQIDLTNGKAFLMAGRLLRDTEIGKECLKVALELFASENDDLGYQMASELLEANT
jgi:hypothetical protein